MEVVVADCKVLSRHLVGDIRERCYKPWSWYLVCECEPEITEIHSTASGRVRYPSHRRLTRHS